MYLKMSCLTGAGLTWCGPSSSCAIWIPGNMSERGPWPQPPSATPGPAVPCFPGQPVKPAAPTHSSSAPRGCLDCGFSSHLSLMATARESAAATHNTYAQAHLVWDGFSFSFKGESNLCLYLSSGTNSQVSDQPSQAAISLSLRGMWRCLSIP